MEQFFRFIRQSERERNRIAHEDAAIYDSVFQAAPMGEQSNKAPVGHTIGGVSAFRNDGVFS